jgi:hypothetical protein
VKVVVNNKDYVRHDIRFLLAEYGRDGTPHRRLREPSKEGTNQHIGDRQ